MNLPKKLNSLSRNGVEKAIIAITIVVLILFAFVVAWYDTGSTGKVVAVGLFGAMVGVFPASYWAYRDSKRETIIQRLQRDLDRLGLIPNGSQGSIENLYETAYSASQFGWYIALIVLLSVAVLYLFAAQSQTVSGVHGWYVEKVAKKPLTDPVLVLICAAYFGAYVHSIQTLFRRFSTFDLRPQVYNAILVRMLMAIIVVYVGAQAITATTAGTDAAREPANIWLALVIAFSIGAFPNRGIRWFSKLANRSLNQAADPQTELSVRALLGVSVWHADRLEEIGIDDAQNLACADLSKLLLTTPFDPQVIVNWVDQAILLTRVGAKIDRFREANICTYSDLLQALGRRLSTPNEHRDGPDRLATFLGIVDVNQLLLLQDFSSYPNYYHIKRYHRPSNWKPTDVSDAVTAHDDTMQVTGTNDTPLPKVVSNVSGDNS
jgi:hypothetical protein